GIKDRRRTRLFVVRKRKDGQRTYHLLDGLERDLKPRKTAEKLIERLSSLRWLRALADEQIHLEEYVAEGTEGTRPHPLEARAMTSLSKALATDEQTLPGSTLEDLRALIEQLEGLKDERGGQFGSKFRELLGVEEADHPNEVAQR